MHTRFHQTPYLIKSHLSFDIGSYLTRKRCKLYSNSDIPCANSNPSHLNSKCCYPPAGPSQPLLLLPGFHLPMVNLTFTLTQKLPANRSPMFHYLYPVLTRDQLSPDARQAPVDVVAKMKCEGWGLGIDIKVEPGESAGGIPALIRGACPKQQL